MQTRIDEQGPPLTNAVSQTGNENARLEGARWTTTIPVRRRGVRWVDSLRVASFFFPFWFGRRAGRSCLRHVV
jgi:hypothetical protein